MKITATVLRSADQPYSIETIELPDIAADEVLVRIVSAGICHTDSILRSTASMLLPIIPGHEGAGVVEAVGAGVTTISPGDHVVLSFDSCGQCRNCADHLNPYCDLFAMKNFVGSKFDGSPPATDLDGKAVASRWFGQSSFATYAIASEQNTVVVDRGRPPTARPPRLRHTRQALDPCSSHSTSSRGNRSPSTEPVAWGWPRSWRPGGRGRHDHRRRPTPAPTRPRNGTRCHTHVLAADGVDVAGAVVTASGGGTDYAFDTTGTRRRDRRGGRASTDRVCGLVGARAVIHWFSIPNALFGKTVVGIFEGNADPKQFIPRMIELWQEGRFPFDRLIETFTLSQIDEAEQASLDGSVIKPVLLP